MKEQKIYISDNIAPSISEFSCQPYTNHGQSFCKLSSCLSLSVSFFHSILSLLLSLLSSLSISFYLPLLFFSLLYHSTIDLSFPTLSLSLPSLLILEIVESAPQVPQHSRNKRRLRSNYASDCTSYDDDSECELNSD